MNNKTTNRKTVHYNITNCDATERNITDHDAALRNITDCNATDDDTTHRKTAHHNITDRNTSGTNTPDTATAEATADRSRYRFLHKLLIITVCIFCMQFCDSFCTDLFSKLQSLYTTDFLILSKGMSQSDALAYLSILNFPFLIVPCLSPLGRAMVDYVGRNRMYLFSILCLICGCIICFFAPNLIIFLLGNAVLTFSYSLDIHYIFIVDEVSPKHRTTIRGIANGITALASMLLPVVRGFLITQLYWKFIYMTAIGLCTLLLIMSVILLYKTAGFEPIPALKPLPHPSSIKKRPDIHHRSGLLKSILSSPSFYQLALPLIFAGAATAGITFYNEPLLSFSQRSETSVDIILTIQPAIFLASSVAYGFLADTLGRRFVLTACTILSILSLILFCITAQNASMLVLPGILWGVMYGSYYSLTDILQLMFMETAPADAIGRFSALAVFIYGFGDAFGLLFINLLVGTLGIVPSKLITTLSVLIICCILLISYFKKHPHSL